MITPSDEAAIMQVPAGAWKPGIVQDGSIEEDKDVAEITHLMTRAGNWPDGLRWVVRRVKPSRRITPATRKEQHLGAVGAGAHPGTSGTPHTLHLKDKTNMRLKNGYQHNQ